MSNPGLAAIDAAIHGAMRATGLADVAIYTAPGDPQQIPCRVYVNRSMQQMGDFGQVSAPRTLVEIMKADVPDPVKGAMVVIAGERFRLESEEAGTDESISRWVVGRGN